MDERRTPINILPKVNGRDIDLYKLFKVIEYFLTNLLGAMKYINLYKVEILNVTPYFEYYEQFLLQFILKN